MSTSLEVIVLQPWNAVSYEQALAKQAELCRDGKAGWLLFCCPPTVTLGKRAKASDVLVPIDELARRGVSVIEVDRGGQVTYHGPGQIIGFPFGSLAAHTGDPRGVRALIIGFKSKLEELIATELTAQGAGGRKLDKSTPDETAGIWLIDNNLGNSLRRKVVSIGMGFGDESIRHGFALNVQPIENEFAVIHPCGEVGAVPGSVFRQKLSAAEFERVLGRLVSVLRGPS